MDSNAAALFDEVRSLERAPVSVLDESLVIWCRFWCELNESVHDSWFANGAGASPLTILAKKNASIYAWNSIYPRLCKQLGFDCRPPFPDADAEKFWCDFLPKIAQRLDLWTSLAGAVALVDRAKDIESEVLKEVACLRTKKNRLVILKLAKNLSIHRRCPAAKMESCRLGGAWLLKRVLQKDFPLAWSRFRLVFPRDDIKAVDRLDDWTCTAADLRNFKRLWRLLFDSIDVEKN